MELSDEILLCIELDDCRQAIEALGSFGPDALEYLTDLRKSIINKRIIQTIDREIVRINKKSV
jgi:hypothetical protein